MVPVVLVVSDGAVRNGCIEHASGEITFTKQRRIVHTQRRDGLPAEGLLHDGLDVRQRSAVREGGETLAANDAIELCLCALLGIRVQKHREEKELYRRDSLSRAQFSLE